MNKQIKRGKGARDAGFQDFEATALAVEWSNKDLCNCHTANNGVVFFKVGEINAVADDHDKLDVLIDESTGKQVKLGTMGIINPKLKFERTNRKLDLA